MADWVEHTKNHAVHATLQQLENSFSSVDTKARSQAEADALARLRHVVRWAQHRLSQADPLLLGAGILDPLNRLLGEVSKHLAQFVGDANMKHLINANIEADKVLPAIGALGLPVLPEDINSLRLSVESFDQATKKLVEELRSETDQGTSQVDNLRTQVQQLQDTIKNEKARIDQAIAQHQKQFSDLQGSRQQTFEAAESQRAQRADANFNSWQEQITRLQTKHGERFSELQTQQKEKFDSLFTSFQSKQKEITESSESAVSALIGDIEARRDKARDIVGLIAGTGMAGGYQKDANVERGAYLLWNLGALVGFGGLIVFAMRLFDTTRVEAQFAWPTLGGRLVVIAAFGAFAAFAGRMAMKHRESERQHRHKQLALESVNAFLEDLEPDVQKQVKQKMADAFFTQAQSLSHTDDVLPTTIDGLFKTIHRLVDKLAK